jgi:hypothetical protein
MGFRTNIGKHFTIGTGTGTATHLGDTRNTCSVRISSTRTIVQYLTVVKGIPSPKPKKLRAIPYPHVLNPKPLCLVYDAASNLADDTRHTVVFIKANWYV